MKKIKHFIITRKVWSVLILLLVAGLAYWVYAKSTSTTGETSYVVSKVTRGNVVTTISGTGQVSASSQVDIKSKVSGDLTFLNTKDNGQQIKKGTLIAQVDTRDELINLESARIAYAKVVKPADASTILQAENALNDAIQSNVKSYDDAFTSVTNAFLDLPAIMNGLNTLLYSRSGYLNTENVRPSGQVALDYQTKAGQSYDKAATLYETMQKKFQQFSRVNSTSTVESMTSETHDLVKSISEALKNTQNALDFVRKQKNDTSGDSSANSLATWTSSTNSNASNLLSAKNTMISSAQSIKQKTIDLADLKNGADALDVRSQQLSLQQKENEYQDYFIRAPFDGLLAKLSVKPTDSVSASTVIGTLVSAQKLTTITLNEVDVSKVHVGQKAKLTFDAIEGLTIDGTVSTVDLIGTVTQGVVNYNVEIVLDTQDDRVKSGMSVSASIIVDTKENVLTVPNSAIKTQGRLSYVEMFATPLVVTRGALGIPSAVPPVRKPVEIGLSNDTLTEIISGINEGDQIVTRTIAGTAAKTATTGTSLFGGGARPTGTGAAGATRTGSTGNFPRN